MTAAAAADRVLVLDRHGHVHARVDRALPATAALPDEVPPPGAGVDTMTSAVAALATSAAEIEATSRLALTTVVGRGDPFHRATENASKPLPSIVSENAGSPARAPYGVSDVMLGTGFGTRASDASASNRRRRGTVVTPDARVSATGKPVRRNASRIVVTSAAGNA